MMCVGQGIMFQDSICKRWFQATITSLCKEPRGYKITTKDGVTYRKMQAHLKPLCHKTSNMKLDTLYQKRCDMQTVRSKCKVNKSDNLDQTETLSPPQVGFIVNFMIIFKKLG